MDTLSRFQGCLLGLAVGDAVGTTVEFMPRGTFPPITDMTGGGPFGLRPGEWTDDTSMALCMAYSLVAMAGFDARDQMERYWRWRKDGYMSSTGRCFDLGTTTARALDRFRETGEPFAGSTDPQASGNGGIMRLAPVVLFYHPDRQAVLHFAAESSRVTHASAECLDAACLFSDILNRALSGAAKMEVVIGSDPDMLASESVRAIAAGVYRDKPEADIYSSGYVVQSLEAALWCFWHSDSYEAAILKAANLGYDADTTAAICGQVAGAFYGVGSIPQAWLYRLAMRGEIRNLAQALFNKKPMGQPGNP